MQAPVFEVSEQTGVYDGNQVCFLLQPPVFESEVSERLSQPGVAVGLAWTAMGGEIMYVEASHMEGEGKLTLTGQLGDVMKESANLALNWLRSRSKQVNTTKIQTYKIPAGYSGKKEFVSCITCAVRVFHSF